MIARGSKKRFTAVGTLAFVLLIALIALVTCGLLTSCKKVKTYTIVYNTMGGSSLPDGTYREDDTHFYLPTPSAGDLYGFRFTGWFYDEGCSDDKKVERKNPEDPLINVKYAVDDVITLYAGWSDLYTVWFDTQTDELIPNMQFHYGDSIIVSELPSPKAMERAGLTCPFVCWTDIGMNRDLTNASYLMDAADLYLKAKYNTGMGSQFDLTEQGFAGNRPTGQASTSTYRDLTLSDGEVLSVAMTFPANYNDYIQDCGVVFSGTAFDATSGAISDSLFFYISSAAVNVDNLGSIQVWGTEVDANDTAFETRDLIMHNINGGVLGGTPYADKISAYKEGSSDTTFVYTIRRADHEEGVRWYIGVDGIEYFSIGVGDKTPRNNKVSAVHGEGNLIGLRSKCNAVYYNDIKVEAVSGAEITFNANGGTLPAADGKKTVEWGRTVGTLPTPVHPKGWQFEGWFYTKDGERVELTAATEFDESTWLVEAVAKWDDPSATHYDIVFETGAEGYEIAPLEDWFGWFDEYFFAMPKLRTFSFWSFDGNWYYDSACTQIVRAAAFDIAKADVTPNGSGNDIITLYAKSTKSAFTNQNWKESGGVYTGTGETYIDGYSLEAGYTYTADVTLNSYNTNFGSVSILFGSPDGAQNAYRLLLVGKTDNNYDAHGAVQLYRWTDSWQFAGAAYSIRRMNGVLAGSDYNLGFDAFMQNGGSFTFTFGVIATEDAFYCTVNGIVVFSWNKPLEGKYVGFHITTANSASFSSPSIRANATKITFNANGGTVSEATRTVPTGEPVGALPTPVHSSGWTFLGWYDGETRIDGSEEFPANRPFVTLVARWDDPSAEHFDVVFETGLASSRFDPIEGWFVGLSLDLPTLSRKGFVTYDGFWYYESTFTNAVDPDNFDISKATITNGASGGNRVITLYAKGTESEFSADGWTKSGGVYSTGTASSTTYLSNYRLEVGKTLSVDITLPAYETSFQNMRVLFGSSNGTEIGYMINILGSVNLNIRNNDTAGAVQFYGSTGSGWAILKSNNVDMSTRRNVGALKDSVYNTRYDAYMASGEGYTFNVKVVATAGKFYILIEDTLLYTYEGDATGYVGIGVAANTAVTFSNLSVAQSKTVVTFDANGGTLAGETTRDYTPGDSIGTLPVPTRDDGYVFVGWYNGDALVEDNDEIPVYCTRLYLVAHWDNPNVDHYDVYFHTDVDGWTVAPELNWQSDTTLELPRLTRKGFAVFEGWYYDAAFANPVGDAFELSKATIVPGADDENGTITLYAKTRTDAFSAGGWTEQDGVYSSGAASSITYLSAYEAAAGDTISVDITLPAYSTDFQNMRVLFGSADGTASGYMINIIGNINQNVRNNDTAGAVQFYYYTEAGTTGGASLSVRRTAAPLAGSSYESGYNAYMAGSGTFTFTVKIVVTETTFHIFINETLYATVSSANNYYVGSAAGYVGIGVGVNTAVTFKNISVDESATVVTLDPNGGALPAGYSDSFSLKVGDKLIDRLPAAEEMTHPDGLVFAGWYDGETPVDESTVFTALRLSATITAHWDNPAATHYDVVFNTGLDGYTFNGISDWYEGEDLNLPTLTRQIFTVFDGNWYYESAFTNVVDPAHFDVSKATITGGGDGNDVITLYAKPETSAFSTDEWQVQGGVYSKKGNTNSFVYLSDYNLRAGQTFSIDVTLPVYNTAAKYYNARILFGSADGAQANSAIGTPNSYMINILGNDGSDVGTHGAVQFYSYNSGGTFVGNGAAISVRRTAAPLAGSSYQSGYNAYMTNGATFTYTVKIVATETTFYILVNEVLYATVSNANAYYVGSAVGYVGFGSNTNTNVTFSNLSIADSETLVRFDAGLGSLPAGESATRTISAGATIGALPQPTREGHVFAGWYYNGTRVEEDTTFPAYLAEITLVAEWALDKTVTIIFNPGDGATVNEPQRIVKAGEALGQLPVPEKSGYRFLGWYDGQTRVDEHTYFDGERTEITLTAQWEDATIWDGTTSASLEGEGTQTNPYKIKNGADLKLLATAVNAASEPYGVAGKYFVVTADIKLNNRAWTSIGITGKPFGGVFDGGNFKITGINVSGGGVLGLFGRVEGATIKNLSVQGNVIGTGAQIGVLAGFTAGNTTIERVTVLAGSSARGTNSIGGLVGTASGTTVITNCVNHADATATATTVNGIGGFVGDNIQDSNLTVTGCVNYGNITGSGSYVGGIVGLMRSAAGKAATNRVENCRNYGNVEGGTTCIGGVTGCNRGVVVNCYIDPFVRVMIAGKTETLAKDLDLIAATSSVPGAITGQKDAVGAPGADVTGCGFCNEEGEQVHVIMLEPDGGIIEGGKNYILHAFGEAIGDALPTPTRDGLEFAGWYNGSAQVEATTTFGSAHVVTLTAHWSSDTEITITFEAGYGSFKNEGDRTRTIKAGEQLGALPEVTAPKTGDVAYWYCDGEPVTEETTFDGTDTAITVTAVYGWDGTTASTSLQGAGEENNPYQINSGADLKYLANQVNASSGAYGAGQYYEVTDDINLAGKAWTPIGATGHPFSGNFDGGNFKITGLNVSGTNLRGLFGRVENATIKALSLQGTATGTGQVAMLAGVVAGTSTINGVTVLAGSSVRGTNDVAGIVADTNNNVTFTNCVNYAEVYASATGNSFVGGIVGASTENSTLTITNCKNYGNIKGEGAFVGGIVGLLRVLNSNAIDGCRNFGNIEGNNNIGGIIGCNRGTVRNCYVYSEARITVKGGTTLAKELDLVSSDVSPWLSAICGRDNAGGTTSNCGLCDISGSPIES